MQLIQLVNFKKENGQVINIGNSNRFTCQFSRPLTIKPYSRIKLIHAEINNTTTLPSSTGIKYVNTAQPPQTQYIVETNKPKDLVYINCPSLPVQTYIGQANGGKGQTRNIIGLAKTNSDDQVISTNIYVDLKNDRPIVLTEMQIEILDSDYDLKTFGGNYRQIITLGIE